MSSIVGVRELSRGDHRLFELMNILLIQTASLATAAKYHTDGEVNFKAGDYIAVEGNLLDIDVRLPLFGPVEAALEEKEPDLIELRIVEKPEKKKAYSRETSGFAKVVVHFIKPIFVDFFETYKPFLEESLRGNHYNWPGVWNFGRVIRNSISHGGEIYFKKSTAQSVSWYGLTYGPPDNGQLAVSGDLSFTDMLILMFEMDDELDRLGCPK